MMRRQRCLPRCLHQHPLNAAVVTQESFDEGDDDEEEEEEEEEEKEDEDVSMSSHPFLPDV